MLKDKSKYLKVTATLPPELLEEIDLLSERINKPRVDIFETAVKEFIDRSKIFNTVFAEELSKKEVAKRPKEFTKQLCEEMFDRLSTPILTNESNQTIFPTLSSVCASSDMPSLPTVVKWKEEIPEFAGMLDQASNVVAHALADKLVELLQIANTSNAIPIATTVKTILDALKQVAPKIFSPTSALTQMTEDKVSINIILNEVVTGDN